MSMFSHLKAGWEVFQRYKFTRDVAWTFLGKTFLALSGILINIIVGNLYGANGLGVFNQALSLYLIISIIANVGIPNSVLRHSAKYKDDLDTLASNLFVGILIVFLTSSLITAIILVSISQFPWLLHSKELYQAVQVIMISLPLFGVNKALIFFLNGLREMKLFSFFQSMRWILIISVIGIVSLACRELNYLFYAFVITEFILFLNLIMIVRRYIRIQISSTRSWLKTHLSFGSQTFFVAATNQISNRINILMVGYFIGDSAAGVFSFAATCAWGLLLFTDVLQNNLNPIIANLWGQGKIEQLQRYLRDVRKICFKITVPLLALATISYPILIQYIMKNVAYQESYSVFYILLVGVAFRILFFYGTGGMLSMTGFLTENLTRVVVASLFNIVANVLMIPMLGINGAAIATCVHFFVSFLLLKYYVQNRMQISII